VRMPYRPRTVSALSRSSVLAADCLLRPSSGGLNERTLISFATRGKALHKRSAVSQAHRKKGERQGSG